MPAFWDWSLKVSDAHSKTRAHEALTPYDITDCCLEVLCTPRAAFMRAPTGRQLYVTHLLPDVLVLHYLT